MDDFGALDVERFEGTDLNGFVPLVLGLSEEAGAEEVVVEAAVAEAVAEAVAVVGAVVGAVPVVVECCAAARA